MQQHLMQMQPMMAAYYPTNNVTTDHIQQYLDENKSLILKIVESQNTGKMAECAEHQAKLQRNLMYLAAIADSQPQAPTLHSQYSQGGMMQQQGGHYMQPQQAQQMSPQALMAARSSMMYSQQQYSALQQQQALQSHLGMTSSGGGNSGLNMLQSDNNNTAAGGIHLGGGFPDFGRKQDIGISGPTGEGRGSGGSGSGDGGETLYLKSPDKGN
ncbi:GRF1-interacting factor 1 [Rutidosis leptorrhynchoides]|uniref:GRF1-interacting factor 1 n=1 Tax=Rutidosis leptorrhynchoides TaxID=125765 RepID=UPI003A996C51